MGDIPTLIATTADPRLALQPGALGPGGIRNELHVLARMPGERRTDAQRFLDKVPRIFVVEGRLGKAPGSLEKIEGDFTEQSGSSYLIAPPQTAMFKIAVAEGVFELRKNAAGEISMVRFECKATSPGEASDKFYQAVLPVLDHFSYATNAPLYIDTVRVTDDKNHRTTLFVVAPFKPALMESRALLLSNVLRPVYAMYREARNASSDFYRFLCFFKLLEALLSTFRARLRQEAKDKGVILPSAKDLVPDHPEIPTHLRHHIGKSIREFSDTVLTPQFRNAIAHFETSDGLILHTSDPAHMAQYANIMLITELCVREVIGRHEREQALIDAVASNASKNEGAK